MKWRKSMRPTPATSVTKVRTRGTNRAKIRARLPYRSKKSCVLTTYSCLNSLPMIPVRGRNKGGPDPPPDGVAAVVADDRADGEHQQHEPQRLTNNAGGDQQSHREEQRVARQDSEQAALREDDERD